MKVPGKTGPERAPQAGFSNARHFAALALLASLILLAGHALAVWLPDRAILGPRQSALTWTPVVPGPVASPLRLAGAWRLESPDPRFGGFSALAIDGGQFVALSDSGAVARFGMPGQDGGRVRIHDLRQGIGDGRFKRNRDSEALAPDPLGRGWWVAFERHHQILLYDRTFARVLDRIVLPGAGWPVNKGIEAMAWGPDGLMAFREIGGGMFVADAAGRVRRTRDDLAGPITDAAHAGGRLVLLIRRLGPAGFRNAIRIYTGPRPEGAASDLALDLGPAANAEALAIQPRGDGWRLWVMTDDNHQRPMATLLVAIDLPGDAARQP